MFSASIFRPTYYIVIMIYYFIAVVSIVSIVLKYRSYELLTKDHA